MSKKITVKVCGKWIWAGEYAVLKSCPALVFPFSSQFIKLSYQKNSHALKIIHKRPVKFSRDLFSNEEQSVLEASKKGKRLSVYHSEHTANCFSRSVLQEEKFNFQELFQTVLDQALQDISKTRFDLRGIIEISSRMVFGSGLGSSSIICASIGKLFYCLKWIKEKDLFYFCHSLENNLHGQSSGVDIATVLAGKPIVFHRIGSAGDEVQKYLSSQEEKLIPEQAKQSPKRSTQSSERATQSSERATQSPERAMQSSEKQKTLTSEDRFDAIKNIPHIQEFQPRWQPRVFLSHSGEGNSTKENIKKMKLFWEKEKQKADTLDQQMTEAVLTAKKGLEKPNKEEGFNLLKKSFLLAEDCFFKWDLVGENMQELISFLKSHGAEAVKPTGSGVGGCVLSLWADQPPDHVKSYLVPAFPDFL